MSLSDGHQVVLDKTHYTIHQLLVADGHAETYLAECAGYRVTLRLYGKGQEDAFAQVEHEAKVLERLNAAEDTDFPRLHGVMARAARAQETTAKRTVIAILAWGQDDGRAYLVQEAFPPIAELSPPQSLADEYRAIQIMQRVAAGMAIAHDQGYSFNDFDPRTRTDRIRARWSDARIAPEVRLIDWSSIGGPEGQTQDLINFGGHLFRLLLGRPLDPGFESFPAYALGAGLPAWNNVSEGARAILLCLLRGHPGFSYTSAAVLLDDLLWLEQTIKLALDDASIHQLEIQLHRARSQRPDRYLAAADLALRRRSLDGRGRGALETWREDARKKLEAEVWQRLGSARALLQAREFAQAATEFERELPLLDPRCELARQGQVLLRKAQIGAALRGQGRADISSIPGWMALAQGVEALLRPTWPEAASQLRESLAALPVLADIPAFGSLQAMAEFGRLQEEAISTLRQVQPRSPDGEKPDWRAEEETQVGRLAQALKAFERAETLMPDAPGLIEALNSLRRDYEQRSTSLPLLSEAEAVLNEKRYGEAATSLNQILASDRAHPRANYLLPAVEREIQFETSRTEGWQQLRADEYGHALELFRAAEKLHQDDQLVCLSLPIAVAGVDLEKQLVAALDQCEKLIGSNLGAAEAELQLADKFERQSLGFLPTSLAPDAREQPKFYWPSAALQERLGSLKGRIVAKRAAEAGQAMAQGRRYWSKMRFAEAHSLLKALDADTISSDQREEFERLSGRVQGALELTVWNDKKISAVRAGWQAGGYSTGKETLEQVAELLEHVGDNDDIPREGQHDAHRIREKVIAFITSHEVKPLGVEPETNLLAPAWRLIADVMVHEVGREAKAARDAGDPEKTKQILATLHALTGELSGEQKDWREWAEVALRREEIAQALLLQAKTGFGRATGTLPRLPRWISERLADASKALSADDQSIVAGELRKAIASAVKIYEAAEDAAQQVSWWHQQTTQTVVPEQARERLRVLNDDLNLLSPEAPTLANQLENATLQQLKPRLTKLLSQIKTSVRRQDDAAIQQQLHLGEALLPEPRWREHYGEQWQQLQQIRAQTALRRIEADWETLDFAAGLQLTLDTLVEVENLASNDHVSALRMWRDRLNDCLDEVHRLQHRNETLRASFTEKPHSTDVVLSELVKSLDRWIENRDFPRRVQKDAHRLREAANAAEEHPDASPEVPAEVASVLEVARLLLRDTVITALRWQVDQARTAHRPAQVVTLMERLSKLRQLDSEEAAWRKSAADTLEAQTQARVALTAATGKTKTPTGNSAEAVQALTAVLTALPPEDASAETKAIRETVATLWREWVRSIPDPRQALMCAQSGARVLTAGGLAADLETDVSRLTLVEQLALPLQEILRFAEDGKDVDAARRQLFEIAPKLQRLFDETADWPPLRTWALQRQAAVTEALASWLERVIHDVILAGERHEYASALQHVEVGVKLAGDEPWRTRLAEKMTQLDVLRKRVAPLAAERAKFEQLKSRLTGGELTLGSKETEDLIAALQPDRSRDPQFEATVEAMNYAQKLAKTLQSADVKNADYAGALDHLLLISRTVPPDELGIDWLWLKAQIEILIRDNEQALVAVVGRLRDELSQAREQFIQQSGIEPAQLVNLIWQARWVLAALASLENGRVRTAVDSLRMIMAQLANILVDMVAGALGVRILAALEDSKAINDVLEWMALLHRFCIRSAGRTHPDDLNLPGGEVIAWEAHFPDEFSELEGMLKMLQDGGLILGSEQESATKKAILTVIRGLLPDGNELKAGVEDLLSHGRPPPHKVHVSIASRWLVVVAAVFILVVLGWMSKMLWTTVTPPEPEDGSSAFEFGRATAFPPRIVTPSSVGNRRLTGVLLGLSATQSGEFDIGTGEGRTFLVSLRDYDTGKPVSGLRVTINTDSSAVAHPEPSSAKTNSAGETAAFQLNALNVGRTVMTLDLEDAGTISVLVNVRPVAVVHSHTHLRGPDWQGGVVRIAKPGERFLIVGRNEDRTSWRVRMQNNDLAWISAVDVNVIGAVSEIEKYQY